ncbi:unnamed protein product [Victoria cruziana]
MAATAASAKLSPSAVPSTRYGGAFRSSIKPSAATSWKGSRGRRIRRMVVCEATSVTADGRKPDMGSRQLMNLLLLGAVSLPTAGMLVPYASFAPPGIQEFRFREVPITT